MKGSWEVEDFAIAESEAILEIINAIADMDGDLSGWVETSDVRILNDGIMEKVKNKFTISLETPVWLPVSEDMQEVFNHTVSQKLRAVSIWMERGYAL